MWFNNAMIFQYELENVTDLTHLFVSEALKPCPPHARFAYGWLPVIADQFVQEVAGCVYVCLGKEERLLPRGVIQRTLAERISEIEHQQDRHIKSSEKRQMAEDIEFELLPKAFCLQKRLPAILDQVSKRLIINTSSNNQTQQLISTLRKSIPGLHIEPVVLRENLASVFANWIVNPITLPASFQFASDCLLIALDDEKKRFNCKGCELPADDILNLVSQGMAAAEISVIWNERIQLTLTDDFVLKRIKCLDYLVDEFNEVHQLEEEQQQDANLTLLAGELRALINDLLSALGPNKVEPVNITARPELQLM